MLSAVLHLLLISSFQTRLKTPQPYFGYHVGAVESKKKTVGDAAITSREKLWKVGIPFSFASYDSESMGQLFFLFLPELTISPRLIGLALAWGPEQTLDIGGGANPLGLFYGLQAGLYYSYLYSEGGYGNSDGAGLSVLEKNTYAFLTNFYFGPKFGNTDSLALKLQLDMQLSIGSISANTIRTKFSKNVGATVGANLQLQF